MNSKSKALLISTCAPIALLSYYYWLSKRKREVSSDVNVSDILKVIARESVSWTIKNQARLRHKSSKTTASTMEEVNVKSQEESQEQNSAPHSPSLEAGVDQNGATFSDNSSEVSSDSGKGGSEIANLNSSENAAVEPYTLYEFELSQPLVGFLIGKYGCNVHEIRDKCGASVIVRKHPCNHRMKLITVEGTQRQIEEAMVMIRKRFPPKRFPEVKLERVDYLSSHLINMGLQPAPIIVPSTYQLHLPASVMFDAYVSAVVSGGQFFLQQPTHPTYSSLKTLDHLMHVCYADLTCPGLPRPLDTGMVCVAPAQGGWFRSQVMSHENDSENVTIKFLDYGGYADLPVESLRQIRMDFVCYPFQAAECYLANIIPVDPNGSEEWSTESAIALEELCSGNVLQAEALGCTVEGVSVVNIYRVNEDMTLLNINEEMVRRGYAKWIESPEEKEVYLDEDVRQEEPTTTLKTKRDDVAVGSKKKNKKGKGRKKDGFDGVEDTVRKLKDLSV
ncbi:unnamed protein product [Notodromas monacha]|uniref:Tudor domain-containing protein n=1 Tax=Notodromas monacha TaxID=399045 RepID=A0A7R9BK19_9CRUS|nr:unnamed protein product [Notodromas monacha]CAG0916677.1 unnamed protein product [Notodromas monacha]